MFTFNAKETTMLKTKVTPQKTQPSAKALKAGRKKLSANKAINLNGIELHINTPQNGWGACSVKWCNCQEYVGNDETCQNCGHNYKLHW